MTRYHTMPYNPDNQIGGALNINRKLARASSAINKANPVNYAFKNKKLVNAMGDIGQFTQNKLLPAVVSTGIPLASTALGGLATMYGGPMAGQFVSGMSQNLMEQYIPDKYQSNNKYIGLLGDAMSQAFDPDPMAMMQLQQKAMGTVGQDLSRLTAPKQKGPPRYNSPYQDLMMQSMRMNQYINEPMQQPMQQYMQQYMQQPIQQQTSNTNTDNAIYEEVDETADHAIVKKPPYQQKEGSVSGLLGGRIKKKRGRKPKNINIEEIEINIKKKPSYKKFSHAKNSALDQLLEAKGEKEDLEAKKAIKEMVEKQTSMLKAMGFGLRN
jgi:hypothetical protein